MKGGSRQPAVGSREREDRRRARLIYNPRAGGSTDQRKLDAGIALVERQGWSVDRCATAVPGHARELAGEAAATTFDAVVICGGDGTINEAVNGLAGSDTALAVVPSGTVNIWARETGIPRDPLQALRLLVHGERRRVDLGRAGERYFLMLASAGTDSVAVRAIQPAQKARWGRLAYLTHGARDLSRSGGRTMSIGWGGDAISRDVLIAIVANTQLYGGALRSTPRARVDDGLLDLCVYGGRTWSDMLIHALWTKLGRHERSEKVLYRQVREVTITSDWPLPVQVDGEDAGDTPMRFSVEPAALTVIVPAGRHSSLFSEPTASTA